jgi:protein-S-isoprenylcysteine O-methyltransferase Ste14
MDSAFRAIVAAILVGFIAHRGFYTRRVQHSTDAVLEQPETHLGSRIAGALALAALLATAVYVSFPAWLSWAALPLPIWLRWLGLAVALAGFGLLQWAQITLGRNWSDAPKMLASQALVAEGPYRWVRHPIYAAFLLILGSLLLISANWLVGGSWIAMTSLDIASRMETEEVMMLRRFGEQYRAYMARTGRLLPRLGGQKRAEA